MLKASGTRPPSGIFDGNSCPCNLQKSWGDPSSLQQHLLAHQLCTRFCHLKINPTVGRRPSILQLCITPAFHQNNDLKFNLIPAPRQQHLFKKHKDTGFSRVSMNLKSSFTAIGSYSGDTNPNDKCSKHSFSSPLCKHHQAPGRERVNSPNSS